MNKEEIIKQLGKNDGNDDFRYTTAVRLSAETDNPVFVCFRSLVNLENKGLINIEVRNGVDHE